MISSYLFLLTYEISNGNIMSISTLVWNEFNIIIIIILIEIGLKIS